MGNRSKAYPIGFAAFCRRKGADSVASRFVLYGLLGWAVEIVWTGLGSALAGDRRLVSRTYLWMFPIYASGGLVLEALLPRIAPWGWFWRGLAAVVAVYVVEYVSGWMLRRATGRVPWDYSGQPFAVHELIRIDYAPAWFLLVLLFERVQPALAAIAAAARAVIK